MPDLSGPFDNAATLQAPWYRDRGYSEPSGVHGVPAAAGAGDLGLTASGFTLSLGLGRAHVRGAYYERTGTAWTDTVPANTSTVGARIDRIVLRRDLVAKTVTPVRIQGTAAASPTAPALTRVEDGAWDLPLFRVTVPANSGTPLVIADERTWIDPDTGVPIVGGSSLLRPATGAYVGARYFERDTLLDRRWDGTYWEVVRYGGLPVNLPGYSLYQDNVTIPNWTDTTIRPPAANMGRLPNAATANSLFTYNETTGRVGFATKMRVTMWALAISDGGVPRSSRFWIALNAGLPSYYMGTVEDQRGNYDPLNYSQSGTFRQTVTLPPMHVQPGVEFSIAVCNISANGTTNPYAFYWNVILAP